MKGDERQETREEGHPQVCKHHSSGDPRHSSGKKPWPLSWIFIIILTYIALQTAFFLFVAD
jgi:hypothetical protein